MITRDELDLAGVVISLLTGLASPAFADIPVAAADDTVTRTVRMSDLDLSTEAGRNTLDSRLGLATWQVCLEIAPSVPGMHSQNGRCRETLMREVTATLAGIRTERGTRFAAVRSAEVIQLMARNAP